MPEPSPLRLAITHRPVGAMLFLRKPHAQHTPAEAAALARHAVERTSVVEIGVAEGVSALALRQAMDPNGTLWLVDPLTSRFPVSPRRVVAKRVVMSAGTASVRWIYQLSLDAVQRWSRPLDFLFIDGDHAETACEADWLAWSQYVVDGGRVAFHDSAVSPTSHAQADWGPVKVVDRYFRSLETRVSDWRVVDEVDSVTVVERSLPRGAPGHAR